MGERASTLVENEMRWAPLTYAVCFVCAVGGGTLLAATGTHALASANAIWMALWWVCLLLWLVPTVSNVLYRARHALPTVGMAPVAVFSTVPALAAWMCLGGLDGLVLGVAAALFVVSLVVTVVFFGWFVRLRAAYARAPRPRPDAVIIVLGGAVRNGRCCRTLVRRLRVARELWVEAPTRTLLLTGGPELMGTGTEAEAMARWLVGHDVLRSSLLLEKRARNTVQNLQFSVELLGEHPAGPTGSAGPTGPVLANAQLCVLSSDYHLYRALEEGRRLGLELVPLAAPTPWTSIAQQWSREVLTILSLRVG